ncbi:MAG: OprO/OprP family phosphate-selective porin [Syntrophobacteraceae bacterium]
MQRSKQLYFEEEQVVRKYLLSSVIMLAFILSSTFGPRAFAQEQQTLAEKLLIILKANHQITQEQYDELLQEAKKEKAAQKAAVAKQVKAQTAKAAKEYKAEHPLGVNASWKNHELDFTSNDGNFTMHVGGRLQVDFGGADLNDRMRDAFPTDFGGYGAEVRRARITLQGTMYHDFEWMAESDFAGGNVVITDLWLTYKGVPWFADVRIGHMKEPFSMEELTSDNWLDFTERSTANCFVTANKYGDYNTGVMLFNTEFDKHMTWAIGGYMQQNNKSGNSFQGGFDNANIAARVTYLPWYADEGCQLVHLGFGFRHLFRSDNTGDWTSTIPALQFQSGPEWHLPGVNTVNTGPLVAEGANEINPEAAFVYGPFSMQGEYFQAFLSNYTTNDVTFTNPALSGYYIMASYFLTGEHRNYDRNSGVFSRPKLLCNFNPNAGSWGAWEIAARYSAINLNDKSLSASNDGGTEQDWTGSLVWYLNPNVRWLFDYVHAHVDSREVGTVFLQNGDANIFDTRFQVVW